VREDYSDLVKPNELEEALAMARASAPREVCEPLSIARHDLAEKFNTHSRFAWSRQTPAIELCEEIG
jgi:hypothetical protein